MVSLNLNSGRRVALLWALLSAHAAQAEATTILQTNDDGWAVANIRAQFDAFQAAGFNVSSFALFPLNLPG